MDRYLYQDRLAPMTTELGFLDCSAESAAGDFEQWVEEVYDGRCSFSTDLAEGQLEGVLRHLLPLRDVRPDRYLFVPTRSTWTACFDNGWRGGDPASWVSQLSTRMGCRGVRISASPHTLSKNGRTGREGANILEVYGNPSDPLNYLRTISVAHDGDRGWTFDQSGEPFNWEDSESYNAGPVRNRFTLQMLASYAIHLGIDAFNPDFYIANQASPAILITQKRPRIANSTEYSLEQSRQGF